MQNIRICGFLGRALWVSWTRITNWALSIGNAKQLWIKRSFSGHDFLTASRPSYIVIVLVGYTIARCLSATPHLVNRPGGSIPISCYILGLSPCNRKRWSHSRFDAIMFLNPTPTLLAFTGVTSAHGPSPQPTAWGRSPSSMPKCSIRGFKNKLEWW